MTRAPAIVLVLGLAAPLGALASCTGVLGLDPPTLDRCLDGGCGDGPAVEAGVDAGDGGGEETGTKDGSDGGASCVLGPMSDAAPPPGVQCGGGCFGLTYCTGSTPVCCQQTDSTGSATYACTTSESACNGYPIACANDDDCGGSEICCHFSTKMICESTSSCPNSDLVCRPNFPVDCPSGKKCNVPVFNADAATPYLLCEP